MQASFLDGWLEWNFTFLQLFKYWVVRTSKFKHILLKSTAYKELKFFQFVFAWFINKINIAKNKEFTFFNVCVKACMKKVLYKVILKLLNLSGDVCFAACSCPAGIGLRGFGNCNHVGGVLFALKDFNQQVFKDLNLRFPAHQNYPHHLCHIMPLPFGILIRLQLMKL